MSDVVRANGVSERENFYIFTVRKLQFLALFCRQIYIMSVQNLTILMVIGLKAQRWQHLAMSREPNTGLRASGASEHENFSHLFVPVTRFLHYFMSVLVY